MSPFVSKHFVDETFKYVLGFFELPLKPFLRDLASHPKDDELPITLEPSACCVHHKTYFFSRKGASPNVVH
jgi:hypothetical protein